MQDIGLIGLGVMGQNLVLNISEKGYKVSVYNRTFEITEEFTKNNSSITGFENIKDFVLSLKTPRKIMIMVKAGDAVDSVISELIKFIDKKDIIIDCGNSFYKDTDRRNDYLQSLGFRYIGLGVSGGEEGARNGASFMAGGEITAYNEIKDIIEKAAATDFYGTKCAGYFGLGGAGHFVKMVHNGIEYIDMQLLSEVYSIFQRSSKNNSQIADIFSNWNNNELSSYLVEISEKILRKKDDDGSDLVDHILDTVSQKGTGQWTSITSLENSIPAFAFSASVFSRVVSSSKDQRVKISSMYKTNKNSLSLPTLSVEKAYLIAKILAYIQGLELIAKVSEEKLWNIDLSECIRVWQGGCIIRSVLLKKFNSILKDSKKLTNLLENQDIAEIINTNINDLRQIASESILLNIPLPGMMSCLIYLDMYSSKQLPANLTAAQRDYFGAHGYKRNDKEGDFHTDWSL
ncbi:MAG: NADP-dependent phosphogluconate dehydrogenase [bacterium]